MIPSPYSEGAYYDAFKRVRNRMCKFNAADIIILAIARLHAQKSGDLESYRSQPPWFLFLLIKWAIIHGDFAPSQRRILNDSEFNRLLNLMHEVDGTLRLPTQFSNIFFFLRGMAYQQFWHQSSPGRIAICRQSLLFRYIDKSHRFRAWFRVATGTDIDVWLDLSFLLLAGVLPENSHYITHTFFDSVRTRFQSSQIDSFLKSISKTPKELKTYLTDLEEERNRNSTEFRERTPLVRYPLINLSSRHYYYSIPVLCYSFEHYVYDTLRAYDAASFMNAFGPMFENYVRKCLEFVGKPFFSEADIRLRSSGAKTVDFFIEEQDANILIDAKGVEMGHEGMTSHRPEIVTGQAKSSIIKGIQQAIETATALAVGDMKRWPRENNFLLIVTFKDLYLGTGSDFYQYVVKERLERSLQVAPSQSIIPLEHMYFISIEELDYLVHILKSRKVPLGTVLRNAVAADREPSTKCLNLSQHLVRQFGTLKAPDYINTEFNTLIQQAMTAIDVKS